MKSATARPRLTRRQNLLRSDTDLGCITELSVYLHLKLTYLKALKHVARERHSTENPNCFTGTKSCKKWVLEWLERNRDFKIALAYPVKKRVQEVEFQS